MISYVIVNSLSWRDENTNTRPHNEESKTNTMTDAYQILSFFQKTIKRNQIPGTNHIMIFLKTLNQIN